MMNKAGIVKSCELLRQLIAENPGLPIIVFAGDWANRGNYIWQYCANVRCEVCEVLDCETPFDNEQVYWNRLYFEEDMADYMCRLPDMDDISDEEFFHMVHAEVAKYEPYWKKVIAIRADN